MRLGSPVLSMDDREKRNEQLKSLRRAFADRCKGTIYHYTSAKGLRGIVENSEIWLTNTEFVNDTTECKALQKEVTLFSEGQLTNKYVKEAWKRFIEYPDRDNCYYIASFSKVINSLGQFRAYGNYCIGFEAKKLVKRRFNLYQCAYDKHEIREWILRKEKVDKWRGNCLDGQANRMAAGSLLFVASRKYKNLHYKEEQEIRLIGTSYHTWEPYPESPGMFEKDPPIHFRDHAVFKTPIPYVKVFIEKKELEENRKEERARETARQMKERKLKEEKNKRRDLLPIREILIGPMPHQAEAKIACEILLCEKGYEEVKVRLSDIPYRGF